MKDSRINSQRHICNWMNGITFTKLLVTWLGIIIVQYDTTIFCEWSTDSNFHIQIEWTDVVSALNQLVLSGQVVYHLQCCWYLYWTASLYIMIAKLCLHYPHILVLTVELDKQLWYQLWTTNSYLDRWGFIYQVVSIFTRQYIYKWWYSNLLCMIYRH